MKGAKRSWLLWLVSVFVFFAFAGMANCADKVRGVTDTEVVIGQWGPQTGPAALWGAVGRGTAVFFELINEQGGIAGRKLKYVLRDDAYQPAKTKAIAKEFVENIGVFGIVGGVGTASGMAVRDYLMENKVPWVGPATGTIHWTKPLQRYLFGVYPLYKDEAYLLTKYAVEQMGLKKIGFFYQNDDYGKEGLEGAKEYLDQKGMQFVSAVPVEVADTDLKTHALKLKESGAEAVIMWILPKHAAIMLQTAKAAGFQPQWIATSTLSDAPMMFNITKGLWKDVVFANLLNWDSPLVAKYMEAQKKYAPKEQNTGIFFLAGFFFAEPMVEGLRRAGKDLNPDSFVKAMESIRNWNDWLGHNCTFTPEDHQGNRSIYIGKCGDGGKTIRMTDWLTRQ
jgi:branched-chain amino acid transport system substrate-binding protein